jgi:hypothetical protein
MNVTEIGFEVGNQYGEPKVEEVNLCIEWIKQYAIVRKSVNTALTSYSWKHYVEYWCNDYVSNGAFIKACIECGLKVQHIQGTPNACVNISSSSISKKRLEEQRYDPHVGCVNWPNCKTEGCGYL